MVKGYSPSEKVPTRLTCMMHELIGMFGLCVLSHSWSPKMSDFFSPQNPAELYELIGVFGLSVLGQ